jgi:hypothetical protein
MQSQRPSELVEDSTPVSIDQADDPVGCLRGRSRDIDQAFKEEQALGAEMFVPRPASQLLAGDAVLVAIQPFVVSHRSVVEGVAALEARDACTTRLVPVRAPRPLRADTSC